MGYAFNRFIPVASWRMNEMSSDKRRKEEKLS